MQLPQRKGSSLLESSGRPEVERCSGGLVLPGPISCVVGKSSSVANGQTNRGSAFSWCATRRL